MDTQVLNMKEWCLEGRDRGASYLIIVHDECYDCNSPIFVFPEQDIREEIAKAMKMGMVVAISTLGGSTGKLVDSSVGPLLISMVGH
jgi:hypothetical protein